MDAHSQLLALAFRPLMERPFRGEQPLTQNLLAEAPDITGQR